MEKKKVCMSIEPPSDTIFSSLKYDVECNKLPSIDFRYQHCLLSVSKVDLQSRIYHVCKHIQVKF